MGWGHSTFVGDKLRPTEQFVVLSVRDIALQYRIHQSRASGYSQYGILKAPGFDYLNWRPYGYPRYTHSNPESYLQQVSDSCQSFHLYLAKWGPF